MARLVRLLWVLLPMAYTNDLGITLLYLGARNSPDHILWESSGNPPYAVFKPCFVGHLFLDILLTVDRCPHGNRDLNSDLLVRNETILRCCGVWLQIIGAERRKSCEDSDEKDTCEKLHGRDLGFWIYAKLDFTVVKESSYTKVLLIFSTDFKFCV